MPSQEYNMSEIAALGIAEHIRDKEVFHGLAEVAAYLDRSISTVRRLIKRRGMPAFSIGPGGDYITTRSIIDAWIRENYVKRTEEQNWTENDLDRP